jgi:hypothetical protein
VDLVVIPRSKIEEPFLESAIVDRLALTNPGSHCAFFAAQRK